MRIPIYSGHLFRQITGHLNTAVLVRPVDLWTRRYRYDLAWLLTRVALPTSPQAQHQSKWPDLNRNRWPVLSESAPWRSAEAPAIALGLGGGARRRPRAPARRRPRAEAEALGEGEGLALGEGLGLGGSGGTRRRRRPRRFALGIGEGWRSGLEAKAPTIGTPPQKTRPARGRRRGMGRHDRTPRRRNGSPAAICGGLGWPVGATQVFNKNTSAYTRAFAPAFARIVAASQSAAASKPRAGSMAECKLALAKARCNLRQLAREVGSVLIRIFHWPSGPCPHTSF